MISQFSNFKIFLKISFLVKTFILNLGNIQYPFFLNLFLTLIASIASGLRRYFFEISFLVKLFIKTRYWRNLSHFYILERFYEDKIAQRKSFFQTIIRRELMKIFICFLNEISLFVRSSQKISGGLLFDKHFDI